MTTTRIRRRVNAPRASVSRDEGGWRQALDRLAVLVEAPPRED